ncbi:hypothetical protein JR316_0012303 [Psilocybe cubensis]|uniref:Uncharacterized protein n=2 Tax=Psilocybe cubensis TaxID=181762 RepID=A0ACB8GIJ6_PSICU|nr:hypothetical protein JR316_0012303 [Psilocybe cubensis]KAH9475192.1 hypothetical protein JR316_0012303 [Psilocybe cubensis]
MLCSKCSSAIVDDLNVAQGVVSKQISRFHTVASLEAEMSQIDAMIENLANRRTMLRRRINNMSPIGQLPPEILTEIFRLACHTYEDGGKSHLPLFFGRICKEWRDIAWSTPLLWNNLSLRISRKTSKIQAELLKDWLPRAQTSPLHINLTVDDEQEMTFCSLRTIMEVLATRSSYWRNFSSVLPLQCYDVLVGNYFPMLSSISLHPPKGSISTFCHPPNMLLSAPKLRDVDLSGFNFSATALPWDQLRRFKTQFLTVEECLKILQQSPTLKDCHLENVYSAEIFPASIANPLQSHLESLDVTLIKPGAVSLLESVTLPFLRKLRIHCVGRPGSFILPALASLVLRSSCALQLLQIEKQEFHEDDLISCLDAIPSLSHLRLITLGDGVNPSTGLTCKLVTMLHPLYQAGRPLLPNLSDLYYHGPLHCDEGSLMAVISSRWRSRGREPFIPESQQPDDIAQLSTVNIITPNLFPVSTDVQCEMKRLSREGMHLDIRPSSVQR